MCALVLGPEDIPGSSVDVPIEGTDMTISEVAEGAEIKIGSEAITSRTITPKKYGVQIKITSEMLEDGKFSMADLQLARAGYKIAEKEDSLIWNAAYTNAGNTQNSGTALTIDYLVDAMHDLESNEFNPTDFIVSPTIASDIRKIDTFVEANKVGSNEVFQNGFLGKIYGMNVFMSTQVNQGTTKDAFVIDKSRALVLAEKRPLSIQDKKDPQVDAQLWVASVRLGASYLFADAMSRIYTS